jgi:endogenous inhibitor of DNA gyrase (YacG/DUF329 family)
LSIRCPACGAKVAWKVVRTAPAARWLHELRSLEACPGCGSAFPPRGRSDSG